MKYILSTLIIVLFVFISFSGKKIDRTDLQQFPKGYPDSPKSVIQQLQSYPTPRYLKSNKLQYLFNWMDPGYMGGKGLPGVKKRTFMQNATEIQKELFTNWHYGIVLPNSLSVDSSFIKLANENPSIPLHVITFWMAVKPNLIGKESKRSYITNKNLDSSLYLTFDFYGKQARELTYNFPDSLCEFDGKAQKYSLSRIINCLTRPINLINENGEEPPGLYQLDEVQNHPEVIKLKNKMKIDSWEGFLALRKLQMRQIYSSEFMREIPELKNTNFNFYQNEGGPINCFDWRIMKRISTPINGNYYSTPDFYPRWPKNWKTWDGPWHGWKWIEIGRQKEINDGDPLFSPFVAAGWSKIQEEDIRPGQWLGLLKCLSGVGAEFYYVGYFSLSAPFTNPAKWTWQAAMPSYAQAVTSRFEDVLKEGNVLFDSDKNPIITYQTNDKHVLVTVRKHNQKEKYIICGTYQPFSNELGEIPEKKNVTISFANQQLSFEVRRQGSVYVYEKTTDGKILFYQLDAWHENAHPDYWSSDFYFEAEVVDNNLSNKNIFTINKKNDLDFTNYITYISLDKTNELQYQYTPRDSSSLLKYVWIKYKGEGKLNLNFQQENSTTASQQEKLPLKETWTWHKINLVKTNSIGHEIVLSLSAIKGIIDIDKLVISSRDKSPSI